MKTLKNYPVTGVLLQADTGAPAIAGDQMKVYLDTELNAEFPEFILGVIQQPITTSPCGDTTFYSISYDENTLIGADYLVAGAIVSVVGVSANVVLSEALEAEVVNRTAADAAEVVARNLAIAVETAARIVDVNAEESARSIAVAAEEDARILADETEVLDRVAADLLKAPLASPTLTGTPLSPTAAPGTNTTQIATTAFVGAAITAYAPTGSTFVIPGPFADDTAAAAGGVALNKIYRKDAGSVAWRVS